MKLVDDGRETASVKDLCKAYGVSEASYYRWKRPDRRSPPRGQKKRHWRSLSEDEEECVLDTLTSDRFVDVAQEVIVATFLMKENTSVLPERCIEYSRRMHPPKSVEISVDIPNM